MGHPNVLLRKLGHLFKWISKREFSLDPQAVLKI